MASAGQWDGSGLMAGDWIKVEKCSPNKPEVMRLARLWGVPLDQALGALVRFWVWIDDASVDGVVDGVASHEIDDMMRMNGFAQGLAAVNWLEIDDAKPAIRIPNFDAHNSETSKKRALRNARQARWREKSVDAPPSTKASTREEKRREDIKPKTLVRKTPRTQQLESPTDEHHQIAAERGLSCQAEFAKYRDWQAATGKRHRDEVAGFRNWLRNAKPLAVVGGRDAGNWWDSEQGTLAKGRELDMTPHGGEGWAEFRARIRQRMRAQQGVAAA